MSKLIDKLNQAAKAAPQSMGFGATRATATKPKMLLIASLTQVSNAGHLTDFADAVLVTKPDSETKKIARFPTGTPWGLLMEDIGKERTKSVVEAGCDFVVFPASTSLVMPEDEKIGKILQVESSLSEGLLKAANELPVDAVLIADEPGDKYPLTWHHLMRFQRFADLLVKPLLVSLPSDITDNELQILWETGVVGLVVSSGVGQSVEKLKELRQAIDKLTFKPRQRKKAEPLLPGIAEKISPVSEAEEEEEEEDEE